MTDCGSLYSFTVDGSRKDNFLNGFRLFTNAMYAKSLGYAYVNKGYRQDIVNIVSDPKSMDLRVPESMSMINKIGITKKKSALALSKRSAKEAEKARILAIDGKAETIEDGKIKTRRTQRKTVDQKYVKAPLDLEPWEKIIPPELYSIYTLAAEINNYEATFNLQRTFRNVKELNEYLQDFMGDDYLKLAAQSPPSTFTLISDISKIIKSRGSVPYEITDLEINKIADQIISDDEFNKDTGNIGLFSDLILGLLPVQMREPVLDRINEMYYDYMLNQIEEEARTGLPGYDIQYPEMRPHNPEEMNLRGISSTDDNYRDPFGIISTETGSGRLEQMFGMLNRASTFESRGGSVLQGPITLPMYEPPPRRDLRPGLPGVFGPGYGLDETPRGP